MLGWFQRKKKKVTIARAHYEKENVGNDASALPYAQLGDLNSDFATKKAAGKAAVSAPSAKAGKSAQTTSTAVETEFTRPDVPAQAGSGLLKKNEK